MSNTILLSTSLYVTSPTIEARQLWLDGDITGGALHLQSYSTELILLNSTLSHGLVLERSEASVSSGATLSAAHPVTVRGSSNLRMNSNQTVGGIDLVSRNVFNETGTLGPRVTNYNSSIQTTLTLNGNVSFSNPTNGVLPDGLIESNLNLGSARRTFSVSDTTNGQAVGLNLTGTVSSSTVGVGLTKTGIGSLMISGAMSFTGPTTIQAGRINTVNPNVLAPLSTVILTGGELQLLDNSVLPPLVYQSQRIGGLASSLNSAIVFLGDATLTVGANNFSTTYAGRFSGTGKLIKTGSGVLTLTGDSSSSFTGAVEVKSGTLAITQNGSLGAASVPVTVGVGSTLRFGETVSTSRTFDLSGGGNLSVTSGKTANYTAATILGGFIRGPGTHVLNTGSAVSGSSILSGTVVNTSAIGFMTFQSVTSSGATTVNNNAILRWDGGSLGAAGRLTINDFGTVNSNSFESIGTINVLGTGVMNHSGSPLVLGGGSVTNVGVYNPSTGAVTPGGTINLGNNDLVVRGGFLRNNGVISTTGNLVIDFGGLAKGAGDYDVGGTQLLNGGQFLAGNSPGLVRNSNLTVTGPSLVGGDLNNATGTVGGFASSANGNTPNSGWSAIEYGNSANTASGLTLQRGTAGKAQWQFRTTLNDGVGNTPGGTGQF